MSALKDFSETQEVKLFLESLRTEGTKYTYSKAYELMLNNRPDEFLALARADKKQAEAQLIQWVLDHKQLENGDNKGRLSGSTIRTWLAAVRSLLDFYEVPLNWKKIIRISPRISKAQDRAPLMNELRLLFNVSDTRMKFVITLLASSGIRTGAFDYLKVGDIELVAEGIGILTVYHGTDDEYKTFVSSECMRYFGTYLQERERAGEKITKDSALLRRMIGKSERQYQAINSAALHVIFSYQWKRIGIRERQFKLVHGFRKFFKTRLEAAGMKTIMIEQLLGHVSGLSANYFRPTMEELKKEYLRYQIALYIDEALEVKTEAEVMLSDSNRKFNETKADLILARQELMYQTAQLNDLKKNQSAVTKEDFDKLTALVLHLEQVVKLNQISYEIMTPEQKAEADRRLREVVQPKLKT